MPMSDENNRETVEGINESDSPEAFVCKAIFNRDEVPLFGKEWKRAKQCMLEVDSAGFSFGGTAIPYKKIDQITLRTFESAFFFKCCVITLKGEDFSHHFAMRYSEFWEKELPVKVERVKEETPFLQVRKAVMVLIIIYIIYELLR